MLDEAGEVVRHDRVELRLARVAYWAGRQAAEAAPALAKLEAVPPGLSPENGARLSRALAAAYGRIGKVSDAARLWRKAADARPEDLGARTALLDLALRAGDDAAAGRLFDEIRAIEGVDGPIEHLGRAIRLIRRAPGGRWPGPCEDLAAARAELEKAARARPSWSRVALTRAEVDQLDGRTEDAIRGYLRAVLELGDREPRGDHPGPGRPAALREQQQRYAEADLVLKRLRDEKVPFTAEAQRLAAQVSFQREDFAGALAQAEGVVSDQSRDPGDLIWLGQLRWAAGRPAEGAFRRAVALAPESPEPWVALVTYLSLAGRKADAEAEVAKAEKALPRPVALLALAQCYEVVGKPDRARTLYDEALSAGRDDARAMRAAAGSHIRSGRLDDAEADPPRGWPRRPTGREDAPWAPPLAARRYPRGAGRPSADGRGLGARGSVREGH